MGNKAINKGINVTKLNNPYHKGGETMAKNIKARDVVKGIFSSYMPVTINTIDSAREVANDVRTIGRQINSGMRHNMSQIDKSQPGRRAIALFSAAKDALTSGNYEIEQANDEMYDDYEEYEQNFSTANMTDDERANTSPEDVILRGNKGVAQTVIRASTAQLTGMNAMSNKILTGTLKGMEASTKSINATIIYSTNMLSTQMGLANNKLDAINKNLVTLINYQNENTTTYYEKNLELMNSMIQGMTNLTAMSQGKGGRDLKNFSTRNGFNIKEYLKRVKKGIKGSAMVSGAGMLGSIYKMSMDNPELMSPGESIGQMLPMLLDMIPSISKRTSKFGKFDKRINQYMQETLFRVGDKLSGNMIASLFGLDSLGNQRRKIGGVGLSNYMKDQLPWNGKAQKALTEVIPELLTSIDVGINKNDKRYFDYDEGTWKARQEIEKDFFEQIQNNMTLELSTLTDKISRKLENSGKSASEISAAKKKISDTVTNRVYGEGDIKQLRQELLDIFQGMNLSNPETTSIFNSIESAINMMTESINDFQSRIGSSDSIYRNINNRSGRNASQGISSTAAYQEARRKRNDINIFSMSYSQDVKQVMKYIEDSMKDEYPEFKMTKEYQDAVLAGIRSGMSNTEIRRSIANAYGRGEVFNKGKEFAGRVWSKITGKKYTPAPIRVTNDDAEDYGQRGNQINQKLFEATYGVKFKSQSTSQTVQPQGNKVGAASSRGSRDAGKSAGAGTDSQSQARAEGKTSIPPVDTQRKKVKDNLLTRALKSFGQAMNDSESNLQDDEKVREQGAEVVNDIASEGSTSFGGALQNLIDTAVMGMSSMISSFTSFGARLFGKEGLISNFFHSDAFKSGMEKIKDRLFNEKDGVFKDQVKAIKQWGSNMWSKTKEQLAKGYDWVYDKYSIYKYGEDYQNNEKWQNSSWMQTLNLKAKREAKAAEALKNAEANNSPTTLTTADGRIIKFDGKHWKDDKGRFVSKTVVEEAKKSSTKSSGAVTQGKSSVPEIQKATEEVKSSIEKSGQETPEILKESVEKVAEAGTESAKKLKSSTDAMTETLVGDPNENPEATKKKYAKSFNDVIKKHLPKIGAGAIVGAGVGMLNGFGGASLLGSLFLPTGIIGGAIVGGGLTLLSQTEAFKSLMFGKKGKDGERSGGLISKELKEKFKKAAPIAVGGAVVGALKSIITAPITGGNGLGILGMQLLPGGILGGAIMGMGVGLLKNSETFKSVLFGKKDENGKRTGTWLSKSYESMKKKMAGSGEGLKKMLKGGAIGAITGTTLAHMGAIPAALSMGGPVGMGIMGLGLGIASSTKRFNEVMFGVEEFDDNGKSLGRKGGVLGRIKNLININVVEPISQTFKSAMLDMIDWTKDKITMPFRTAFGPILDSIKGIKDNVVELISDQFKSIGEGITNMIKNTLGKLFSPITKLIGGIGKAMIGGAKVGIKAAALPLTAGLGAMNFLTSGKRMKEYGKFYKEYYTKGGLMNALHGYWDAEQADYDEEAAATGKRAKKVGFFDKASDFLSAITGNGVIADAAREGYNKAQTDGGQNTFNWRNVTRERRELKQNRRDRHKAERQWNDISKLSRRIGNRDLGGREVTLTDSIFEKYKKKYTKLGIDSSLINTNDDLMELIYHPEKFRKRAAGDSGENGMMQALKAFRLSPEELEAMKETKQYQTNVEKYLKGFSDKFEVIGQEVLFNRQLSSYKEDRARDTKLLKRRVKRLSKNSTLWEGRGSINFNDPELYEYDIEGLKDDDLQDYAASNFADNNDFTGWLASIGRKMSPDDSRMKFATAESYNKSMADGGQNTLNWRNAIRERREPKQNHIDRHKAGKSSTQPDPTQQVVDELKKSNDIAETQMAINAGGQSNAKKVMNKAKSGTLDAKTSSKFSIGGIFNNIFNHKAKADKKAARDAKEAKESAHAQALGDTKDENKNGAEVNVNVEAQKEEKQGFFSKIFGAIGGGLSWFGNTKVGKIVKTAGKTLGIIGALGGIGLTIAEIIKPGTADNIGAVLSSWNDKTKQEAEDGTLLDGLKSRITGWFNNMGEFINTKVLSEDGYLVTGAQKIADVMPTFMEKFVVPGIQNSANFIANNAETLVGAAGTVITAIAPPLAEAVATVIPSVIGSLGKGFWNGLWGKTPKTKGKENLTEKQKEDVKSKGGSYRTKWDTVTEEEAQQASNQGYEVQQLPDGTWQVKNDYTIDSNIYVDDKGRDQTRTKQGVLSRVAQIGARLGINVATGRGRSAAKMVGSAARWIGKGFGGITGGILGSVIPGAGTVAGAAGGAKLGGKFVDTIGRGVKSIFNKVTGKTAKTAAEKAATKSSGNFIQNFINKITKKGVSEAAEDTAESATKALLNAAGKTAGSGMDDVAKFAAKESDGFLKKIINVIKDIPNNAAVKKVIDSVAGTKAAQVLSGLKKWVGDAVKKLTSASAEVIKGTKLGKKIQKLLSEKVAKQGAKSAAAVSTAMLADIAFATIGGITGAFDAANLFEVSKNAVDWKMRVISGLLNGLLTTSIGDWVDTALLVLELFTGFDARKYIASFLYKHISLDSEKSAAKLNAAQDQLAIETALYNQANGTNMSASEYNDVTNKTVLGKAWDWIRGKSVDTKEYSEQAKRIMESGSYTRDKNGDITINNVSTTINNNNGNLKNSTKRSGNFGTGPVGYGPMSQSDAAWANMPIGRFANGKVSTMRTGGCGPTALSTIANMFGGGAINPGTVGAYAVRNGYITDGGANEDLFTKGAAGLGLTGAKVSGSNFNSALNSGMPMAISGKNSGPFTKAGHVVVAKGMDRNGNINIIDPIDGRLKKYSKNAITSGMTNAWAYNKPIGYGPVSTLMNNITNGLSDETKKMIVNNLGLVQNAISNVPQIMQDTMEGAFKVAAKAITTPIAIPIEFAVKSLGIIGKLIAGDTNNLTTEEIQSSSNVNTMLTKMSNSLRRNYSNNTAKISTSKVSVNRIRSNTNKASNNSNILTKTWNWITGKSRKAGNGIGSIGYGMYDVPRNAFQYSNIFKTGIENGTFDINNTNSNIIATNRNAVSQNSGRNSTTSTKNGRKGKFNNTSSATVSMPNGRKGKFANTNGNISSTYDKGQSMRSGMRKANAGEISDSEVGYRNTGAIAMKSSNSNIDDSGTQYTDTTSGAMLDNATTETSGWDKAKSVLSAVPTTLGGLVGGLKQIGNVMSALWGSIIGEGTFMDLLNNTNSGTSGSDVLNGSGNYESYSGGAEQTAIWSHFLNKGFSKNAIAGLMGAWQHESSNKALRVEGDYLQKAKERGIDNILATNASLDDYVLNVLFPAYDNTPRLKGKIKKNAYKYNGHYYPGMGLAQWTGSRAYALGQFAKSRNSDWRSLQTQLAFVDKELDSRGLVSTLNAAESPEDAAYIVAKKYEVGGYTGDGLRKRQASARSWYNTYANSGIVATDSKKYRSGMKNANAGNISDSAVTSGISSSDKFGVGPVGYGPDDGPTNWSEFMQGSDSAMNYLNQRLVDMGLGDFLSVNNSSSDGTGGITYDPSQWGSGSSAPVNAMKSIYGKLHYSLSGNKQDPDKGVASCASTVAWAYKKALGIRPGDTVSSGAYMSSTSQAKDNRFTTIWTNNGSGLPDSMINNLMPGDIIYQNWNQTRNNGTMKHTEMYAGNGKTLSHGGPNYNDMGPVYRDLTSSNRRAHTMMIRRYNGFLKNGSANSGFGPGSKDDYMKMENAFYKEINSKNYDHTPKNLTSHEGENTGYGTGNNPNVDVTTRLDKILTVIGEWYTDSKNRKPDNNSVTNNTNTTVVNNSTVNNKPEKQIRNEVTTHIDKLAQRHESYSKMYKSNI